MGRYFLLCIVLYGVAFFAFGCSTPATRIRKHSEVFEAFPVEVKELVRVGQIDLGFTPDMVEIALGRPNRIYTRRTARGISTIWAYTEQSAAGTRRQRVDGQFRVRDASGQTRLVRDSVWVDVPVQQEYDRLRVEFESQVVTAIEEAGGESSGRR